MKGFHLARLSMDALIFFAISDNQSNSCYAETSLIYIKEFERRFYSVRSDEDNLKIYTE